jgi:DNA repair exonuclease SbcCD ATPase subunit
MVKTANDVMDINPLERMDRLEEISSEKRDTISSKKKELAEFEKSKRRELEDLDQKQKREIEELEKKKQKELGELEKKKKELSDLEQQKLKEIEETEELIEKSFQDLMRHKRLLLKEEDDIAAKKLGSENDNLEDIANTIKQSIPKNINVDYSKFFENLQAPKRLYEVTNSGFYNGLSELRNRAANGEITPEEERFVAQLRSKFEQFTQNQDYVNTDQNQYVQRSLSVIDQIWTYKNHRETGG